MDELEKEKELVATYRAEAASLFAVNQAGRGAAERVVALMVSVVGVVIAAGIGADNDDVAIPLPTIILLLLTYMFHQYADATVLGKARGLIEQRVNALVGGKALIYETAVAEVRQQGLLVVSVRMLQGLAICLVAAVVVVGTFVAFEDHPWYTQVGYVVATAGALVTAAVAYLGMLKSDQIAEAKIGARLKSDRRRTS